jgi:hypothetical protein
MRSTAPAGTSSPDGMRKRIDIGTFSGKESSAIIPVTVPRAMGTCPDFLDTHNNATERALRGIVVQ